MKTSLVALTVMLPAVLTALSCVPRKDPAEQRAAELSSAALKIVRLEQRAHSEGRELGPEARLADSLFKQLGWHTGAGEIRAWVRNGEGGAAPQAGRLVELAPGLPDPDAGIDPAAAAIGVLVAKAEAGGYDPAVLDAYGAALLLNMEERRELGFRLGVSEFVMGVGCPVTFKQFGLDPRDETALRGLAEQAASMCEARPYGTSAEDFLVAMRRLNDVASRFGGLENEDSMAVELMDRDWFSGLRPGLESLGSLTVAFFGDSQTDNRHWSSPAHYPNVLMAVFEQINSDVIVVNAGVGGDDTNEGLARMEEDVLAREPDICFILFGGNDSAFWGRDHSTVSPEQFEANLREMVRRLERTGCRPVLMSYPEIPDPAFQGGSAETLAEMNRRAARVRDELGAGWLDVRDMFERHDARRMFATDMIHFSPRAHLMIARLVLEYLVENNT